MEEATLANEYYLSQMYGMKVWGNLFNPRQSLALTTLVKLVQIVQEKLKNEEDKGLAVAVSTCLSLIIDKQADYNSSLCTWNTRGEYIGHTFGRQALPMVWDYIELQPFGDGSGNFDGAIDWTFRVLEQESLTLENQIGSVAIASANNHPLPDNAAQCFFSDPPYYDAIAYGDLSDFFYIWLRRTLAKIHPSLFSEKLVDKTTEIVNLSKRFRGPYPHKTKEYFEQMMQKAMAEGCRVLSSNGIGTVVFAHKSTSGWEAMLQAMVDAGWIITGSWSIDTEMGT